MTTAEHRQKRCRLRVRPSRHGQPLPIAGPALPDRPAMARSGPPFAVATDSTPLVGAPRRCPATDDGSLGAPAGA